MIQIDMPAERQAGSPGQPLSTRDDLRYRLGWVIMHLGPLAGQVKGFGRWLESEALPAARKTGRDKLHLELPADAGAAQDDPWGGLRSYPKVCEFLSALGIRRLELGVRLESNQIADVLALLFAYRRSLSGDRRGRGVAAALSGEAGVQFACTRSRIRDGTLEIAYSYCITRFSLLVRWFVRHSRHFSDHRALFHIAPRYALLAGGIAVVPFVIYTFFQNSWLLLAVTALVAVALFVLMYLFFMVVGSVEYDNEEKADRLARAYEKIQGYTARIQEDLLRARTVQQQLLPEISNMPLSDRLDWASSFVPETEVGGDYFDAAALDADRVAVLFSDVSGHGMSAALVTAILKCGFQDWLDGGGGLAELVRKLNRQLVMLTPEDSFAALFLAIYNHQTGEMTYVNCGHNPEPWRIPADDDEPITSFSSARTTLLGVVQDIEVVQATEKLRPGDKILFVTDGIVEARQPDGTMYTKERLEQFLQGRRAHSAEALVQGIVDELARFVSGAEQIDDHTVLAFQVKAPGTVELHDRENLEYEHVGRG